MNSHLSEQEIVPLDFHLLVLLVVEAEKLKALVLAGCEAVGFLSKSTSSVVLKSFLRKFRLSKFFPSAVS